MENTQEPLPQFMTLDEVADRLKVSRRTINRYIERKSYPLPIVYLSDKTPRVPWDQFEIWIKSIQERG